MAHFALICPPFASHLHSASVLGEELVRRGHRATFLLNADTPVETALPVVRVAGRAGDPPVARVLANATRPSGLLGTLRTIADAAKMTDQLCAGGPALLRQIGADAIVGDQLEPAAGLLSRALGLPQIGLAAALPIDPAPGVVLPFLDWPFDPSPKGVLYAQRVAMVADLLSRPQYRVIENWSAQFGIVPPCRTLVDCLSPQTQFAQVVAGFDFPRPEPVPFVGVGPLRTPAEEAGDQPLPFIFDSTRPLVFATFGTLQGGRLKRFRQVADACRAVGAELLVAHGGQLTAREAASVGADHVTDFVPYRAVLKRAALCITHGGSNTVLDALACGVPLLVRPVAFDQQGNLARVIHHGLGERLARRPEAMAAQVARAIGDPAMRERCAQLAKEIGSAGGRNRAADMVETLFEAKRATKRKLVA